MANLGWAWEEVERLTLSRLFALYDTWSEYPPTRVSIALMAGTAQPKKSREESFDAVMSLLPSREVSSEEYDALLREWGF